MTSHSPQTVGEDTPGPHSTGYTLIPSPARLAPYVWATSALYGAAPIVQYYRPIPSDNLGVLIREHVRELVRQGQTDSPASLLYAEHDGGFACGTCRYATPVNATHGRCVLLPGTVHLTNGCCAGWDFAPALLQVREAEPPAA